MKCRDAHELINAYIDNGIDPANDKLLQEHLAQCEKCRAELKFLMNYKKTLAEIKSVKAPAGFMYELRRRIESERSRPYRKYFDAAVEYIRSIHFPAEAAALVILVSIIFTLYRPDKLFIRRVTTPVTEYSENAGTREADTVSKGSGPAADQPAAKIYGDNVISRKQPFADDKVYPVEKEKSKGADITERSNTLETADSVKRESSGAEELAASSENESDFYMMEKSADEKKDSNRSESRVMGKQRLDAAPDITPKEVCRGYNAEIVKTKKLSNSVVEYTIEVRDNNAEAVMTGLRRHFTVKYKSKEIYNGHIYIVLEIKE
ncbi:MAG TPA: zf-HC2 domain-containing protein [Spirochaetota bacterium]|nr:zf-HC2 domain-containing protein [Spirochaetota bacterium]